MAWLPLLRSFGRLLERLGSRCAGCAGLTHLLFAARSDAVALCVDRGVQTGATWLLHATRSVVKIYRLLDGALTGSLCLGEILHVQPLSKYEDFQRYYRHEHR